MTRDGVIIQFAKSGRAWLVMAIQEDRPDRCSLRANISDIVNYILAMLFRMWLLLPRTQPRAKPHAYVLICQSHLYLLASEDIADALQNRGNLNNRLAEICRII